MAATFNRPDPYKEFELYLEKANVSLFYDFLLIFIIISEGMIRPIEKSLIKIKSCLIENLINELQLENSSSLIASVYSLTALASFN